jgi:hypothetical protein
MTEQTATRTRRVVTTDEPFIDPPKPGDIVCLVECEDTMWAANDFHRPGARQHWNYLTADPRTNQSHETRWEGWLGTTNNIAEHAMGAWRVVSIDTYGEGRHGEPTYLANLVRAEVPQ